MQKYNLITFQILYCRSEVSDDEVKLFFGRTFLTVPKSVFDEQQIEIID